MFSFLKSPASTRRNPARQPARRLSLENLERREVMAGNVLASVVSGELRISGDDASNGVVVSRVNDSTIEVRGITVNGVDTKLNGTANGSKTFNNVTRSVYVEMKGGNDVVRFHGTDAQRPLKLPSSLIIQTHGGNDSISLFNTKVGADLSIYSGNGVDEVYGVGIHVANNAFVRELTNTYSQGDRDFVNIYDNSVIGKQLNVKFNAGNDTLKVSKTTADSLWIDGDMGNDSFTFDTVTTWNDLIVNPGKGSDTTSVLNSVIGDDLFIEELVDSLANDKNSVTIQNTKINDGTTVLGSAGVDTVAFRRSNTFRLSVKLAGNNDSLNIVNSTIRDSASLDGGSGTDKFNRAKNNKTLGSYGFESFSSNELL
jgi:hypothetical protein